MLQKIAEKEAAARLQKIADETEVTGLKVT